MQEINLDLAKLHPSQQVVFDSRKRFNVLKIGRRWGKTHLSQHVCINAMLLKFPVGYWCPTYKDLFETWQDIKRTMHPLIAEKHESVKQLKLITGGFIDFWSMEDPDSGRGRKYKVAVIDEAEKAHKFQEAWQATIRPTLTDYQGDAWIMSTPKMGKTFFKELFDKNKDKPDWATFNLSSYDNPLLPPGEVDNARGQMDELTFKCEYLAEDVDVTGKPFMYCFDPLKHIGATVKNARDTFYLSFDFNVDPITCIVAQIGTDFIFVHQEYRLRNSNLYELCSQIKATYGGMHLVVTGDASGLARDVRSKGNVNNYTIIMQELGLSHNQVKLPTMNPPISESRTLCNSIFARHPNIQINPACQYLIEDLKYVQVKEDGSIDKASNAFRSHLLDTWRYLMNSFKHSFIQKNY